MNTISHMAADVYSPKNITKVLKKLKYKISGRQGVRRSTIKAKGTGVTRTGEKVQYTIVLELSTDLKGLWVPVPDKGTVASWHLSKSYMISVSEIEKLTTRKLVKSREDVGYILDKISTKADPSMFD